MIVAIDGPAGAGKSTVARAVAKALGWDYLDTGAMYRAVALLALEQQVSPDDEEGLARISGRARIRATDHKVQVNDRDVTHRIRDEDVTQLVSRVAAIPRVRQAMAAIQRRAADAGDVVIEGRDIGSNVAPQAEVKVYLTASSEERARRRVLQQGLPLSPGVIAEVRAAIEERDARDASRSASPLKRAHDALLLDTTDMDFDEVVSRIVALVHERVPR